MKNTYDIVNVMSAFVTGVLAGLLLMVFTTEAVYIEAEKYRTTAYCPCEKCCGKWADGITASGHNIKKGDKFVAADPNIPFRTMFIVPGYNNSNPVPVLDRGGAIKGNRLDVYFDTHQEALNWGVQWLKVKKEAKNGSRIRN